MNKFKIFMKYNVFNIHNNTLSNTQSYLLTMCIVLMSISGVGGSRLVGRGFSLLPLLLNHHQVQLRYNQKQYQTFAVMNETTIWL